MPVVVAAACCGDASLLLFFNLKFSRMNSLLKLAPVQVSLDFD